MPLFKTEIELVHPITKALTPVVLWIDGPSQGYADTVAASLLELTSFTGKATQLRALAVALIADIDSKA